MLPQPLPGRPCWCPAPSFVASNSAATVLKAALFDLVAAREKAPRSVPPYELARLPDLGPDALLPAWRWGRPVSSHHRRAALPSSIPTQGDCPHDRID